MRYTVLGPLGAADPEFGDLTPGGRRERRILAALLLHRGRVAAVDDLVDLLWGEPPMTSRQQVQNCVASLNRRLRCRSGPGPITRIGAGYCLPVDEISLDLLAFEAEIRHGRRLAGAGDTAAAAVVARRGLARWRGDVLGGEAIDGLEPVAIHLREARLAAYEECVEWELGLGRHDALIGELRAEVAEHPLRERLIGHLMRALATSGRTAEALEIYRTTRRLLLDEHALEPGPALQAVHLELLRHPDRAEVGSRRPQTTATLISRATAAVAQLERTAGDLIAAIAELRTG